MSQVSFPSMNFWPLKSYSYSPQAELKGLVAKSGFLRKYRAMVKDQVHSKVKRNSFVINQGQYTI